VDGAKHFRWESSNSHTYTLIHEKEIEELLNVKYKFKIIKDC
jgi:hypothetical protein